MGARGAVGLITCGWRHEEDELEPLLRDLGAMDLRVVHLPLYRWFDELMEKESVLSTAYQARQREIVGWKAGYREQLGCAMHAVGKMQARARQQPGLFAEDLDWTVDVLRTLDARALQRLAELRAAHPACARPWDFPTVRSHHARVKDVFAHVDIVLIAGGHVGVLRNRLEFFGVDVLLRRYLGRGGSVVAWSAGAMVLGERIYLYYDDPPEGEADAELFDAGFGIIPGAVLMPHARRRLRFNDGDRMARFARRLGRRQGITLENGARLDWRDDSWMDRSRPDSSWRLSTDGPPVPLDIVATPLAAPVGEVVP